MMTASTPTISIDNTCHADVPALVESIDFGTDGLKYQRRDVSEQIGRFNSPVWFHAMYGAELAGVYLLDRRDLLLDDQPLSGYYRGVLAVGTRWQGQGIGRQLVQSAMQWMASQAEGAHVQNVHAQDAHSHAHAKGNAVVSYGCIDQSNTRSLELLRSSGAIAGPALSMYMMYRQWPRETCQLEPIGEKHADNLAQLTNSVYGKCRLRDISPSRLPGFVLEDDDGIAVSARVSLTHFRIASMGAAATWSTRLFVRPFAPARKRFDPDAFRYVSFSDVLIRPGSENQWPRFVSTVLAKYGCHFGALYVDPASDLFAALQSSSRFSRWLHSSKGSIQLVMQVLPNKASGSLLTDDKFTSGVYLWPVDA